MFVVGFLVKKVVEVGLCVKFYIRISLFLGSGMVIYYFSLSGVLLYLSKFGFEIVGYGCLICVGNIVFLLDVVLNVVKQGDLVICGILFGNKNFEGCFCDCVCVNYFVFLFLVVVYVIVGIVNIDFQIEFLGIDFIGKNIYLYDIWFS